MKHIILIILAAIFTLGILPRLPVFYSNLFLCLLGLASVIFYKQNGKHSVDFQIKLHKFLNWDYKVSKSDILMAQLGSLVVGILLFCVGLAKLFS